MADTKDESAFRVEKLYVKDLSFENPNTPRVFQSLEEPKVEVKLSLTNREIGADHWEVALKINVTATSGPDTTLFIVELEHAGAFLIKGIPADHLPGVLEVDCPLLLFPFTRQILSQAVLDGGFPPFLLEPINFRAMYEASLKAKAEPN